MNQLAKLVSAVAVSALSIALAGTGPARADKCPDPDNITYVQGRDHCLAIQTYWAGGTPETLAVYFHGDVPSGRPVDFVFGIGRAVALRGANAVILIRPGFRGAGRRSSGTATHDQYAFASRGIDEIESMGEAVARLKAHHRATRLVLMGSSGGALIAGVLLGMRPDLVDAVLLISCPCDVPQLLFEKGFRSSEFTQSPHKWLEKANPKAKIVAVSGSADHTTPPHHVEKYIAAARARGHDAQFLIVPGAGHGGRPFGPIVGFALNDLFRR
ncbi:MAG: prolyl oligopeptidase family serine peptidase [Rhodospirillaceae bacterium]|nr:prolyl oligopeptidase family serine peptidase [Rhodospirillaceae bacterium]